MNYIVHVGYDSQQRRYFVEASDLQGLNVEADSFEELVEITQDLMPDLVSHPVRGATIRFERDVVLV